MNPIGAGFGLVGNLVESQRAAGASQVLENVLASAHYDFRTFAGQLHCPGSE